MNKIILITGTSRGIGKALMTHFLHKGHTVIANYHSTCLGISFSYRSNVFSVRGDIADKDFLISMVDKIQRRYGRIDVLINNAGVCWPLKIKDSNLQDWDSAWRTMFDVNLFGAVNLTFLAVQKLMGRGAKIINICSRVAFRGESGCSHYAASKAALLNFTRSMAVELVSEGISFFSISPCWVDTDMARQFDLIHAVDDIPLKRMAKCEDIIPVIDYLVESNVEFQTGANFDVNGGSYFH